MPAHAHVPRATNLRTAKKETGRSFSFHLRGSSTTAPFSSHPILNKKKKKKVGSSVGTQTAVDVPYTFPSSSRRAWYKNLAFFGQKLHLYRTSRVPGTNSSVGIPTTPSSNLNDRCVVCNTPFFMILQLANPSENRKNPKVLVFITPIEDRGTSINHGHHHHPLPASANSDSTVLVRVSSSYAWHTHDEDMIL